MVGCGRKLPKVSRVAFFSRSYLFIHPLVYYHCHKHLRLHAESAEETCDLLSIHERERAHDSESDSSAHASHPKSVRLVVPRQPSPPF